MSDLPSLWKTARALQSEPLTPSLPRHALLSTSTVQSARHNRLHYGRSPAPPGYGLTTIDTCEPQHPTSTGDVSDVSTEALQKPGYRVVPPQRRMLYSSLANYDSASATSPAGNIEDENRALSLGYSYWSTPNHARKHVTNDDTTISAPHTTNYAELQAIGQPSRCQQENCNFSMFNHRGHGAAELTMGPDPFDDHTSGQVVGSLATGSELPSSLLHQRQDTHPSGGLTSGSVPLLRDQVRTGMAASAGFYGGVISQPTQQTHLPTTFSDTLPTPPQHNPAFYPTPNDSTLCHPSMQMGNKMPTPQFPQSLQGPRFHTSGTVDHHTAHMLSNHRLPTSSNRATYNPDDLSTRNPPGVVYEYGSFDHKKYNSAQIAGSDCQVSWSVPSNSDISVPQELYVSDYSGGESARIVTNPSAPTMHTPVTHVFHDSTTGMTPGFVGNHAEMDPAFSQNIDLNLPSSSLPDAAQPPYELYTSNHLPNTGGGDLTIPSGFPAAYHPHKHAHRNRIPCGWVNPNGMRCNMFIGYDCKEHFATVHGIKNISSKEKIPCHWCRLDTRQRGGRKGFLRHIREVHMKFRREKKRGSRTLEKKKRRRDQ